jgi:cysteine dioxygenase
MDALDRLTKALSMLERPSPRELRTVIAACPVTVANLEPLLPAPSIYPYGRKVLFQSDHIELLVMNWAPRECAPHDHGRSWGWLSVLEGVATHTVYRINGGLPVVRKRTREEAGAMLFAPQGLVHSMGNPCSDRLVTLHAYAPPITGMRVYDLHRCAACVVSDDCGAWWPESQRQIVRVLALSSAAPSTDETE